MTPISESAPHIYLSALPFTPEHSLVTQKFSSRFPNTLTVTEGRPAQWPSTLFTIEHDKNQVATMDTQDDVREVIAVSPSGKMVVTQSKRSVEFWDTTIWEVIRRMDTEFGMKIAFSPDENQVAVLSKSLITVWDINNPENRLSFNPWPSRRDVRNWQVAFQTSDHVVVCAKLEGR